MNSARHIAVRSILLCLASLYLSGCALLSSGDKKKPTDNRPNIVFIISDDHTSGHFGLLDPDNFKTPNLNRLASEGMIFTRAYVSVPQCAPSRASLMAGQPALAIRATRFSAPLDRDVVSFPQMLADHGYYTGTIGRSHHLDGSPAQGENADRVFDEFSMRTAGDRFDFVHSAYGTQGQRDWITSVLQQFLMERPESHPFFIQFNFTDPHRPWNPEGYAPEAASISLPPDMPDRQSVREDFANYVGEIERMDELIGELLRFLAEQNALDNTLIVFMGDNGAAVLRGKGTLYEAGIRVPLIAWMPGTIPEGGRSDELIAGEDIAPTFLEFAGVHPAPSMTGMSFSPILKGHGRAKPREFVFSTRGTHGVGLPTTTNLFDLSRAVVSEDHKLIYNVLWQLPYRPADAEGGLMWKDLEAAYASGELSEAHVDRLFANPRPMFELYDLKHDPFEMNNRIADQSYDAVKEILRAELERWMIINRDYVPLPFLPEWQDGYEPGLAQSALGYEND